MMIRHLPSYLMIGAVLPPPACTMDRATSTSPLTILLPSLPHLRVQSQVPEHGHHCEIGVVVQLPLEGNISLKVSSGWGGSYTACIAEGGVGAGTCNTELTREGGGCPGREHGSTTGAPHYTFAFTLAAISAIDHVPGQREVTETAEDGKRLFQAPHSRGCTSLF